MSRDITEVQSEINQTGDFLSNFQREAQIDVKTNIEEVTTAPQTTMSLTNPIPGLDSTNTTSSKTLNPDQLKALQRFRTWRAKTVRNKAYAQFEKEYGINIHAQDRKNRRDLFKRLAKLEGPFSEDMRKLLTEKLQTKEAALKTLNKTNAIRILTPEERKIFDLLSMAPWNLHQSYSSPELVKQATMGNEIVSLMEKQKRNRKSNRYPINSSSMMMHERFLRDEVFFNFEPGEIPNSPESYLNIIASYSELENEAKDSLIGLWYGDLDFKEKCERNISSQPTIIFGVEYWVSYQEQIKSNMPISTAAISMASPATTAASASTEINSLTANSLRVEKDRTNTKNKANMKDVENVSEKVQIEYLKTYHFKYPDGSIIQKVVKMEDEIFKHPHLTTVFILRTIENIRLLGPSAWEQLMNSVLNDPTNLKTLRDLVRVFHTDELIHQNTNGSRYYPNRNYTAIIHKPKYFRTDHKTIKFLKSENHSHDNHFTSLPRETYIELEALIKKILQGDISEVLSKIKNNFDPALIVRNIMVDGIADLSLLIAAIQVGKSDLVAELLTAITHSEQYKQMKNIPKLDLEGAIFHILKLSSEKPSAFLANQKMDIKQRIEASISILKLLLEFMGRYHNNPNIHRYDFEIFNLIHAILVTKPDPKLIIEMLPFFLKNGRNHSRINRIPLFLAAYLNSVPLADAMIKMGSYINHRNTEMIHYDSFFSETLKTNMPLFAPGMTILMLAVVLNDQDMVKYLLSQKTIHVDAPLTTYYRDDHVFPAIFVTEYEGFTALMFSIQYQYSAITELLLAAKANIYQYAANGLNAVSLASKLKLEGMSKLLDSHASSSSLKPSPLPKLIEESFSCKIHQHQCSIIMVITDSEKNRLFFTYASGENLVSFKTAKMSYFSAEKFLKTSSPVKLDSTNTIIHTMGTLAVGIKETSSYFANKIIVLEINEKASHELIKTINPAHLKNFISTQELFSYGKDSTAKKQDKFNHLTTVTIEILRTIATMVNIRPFSHEELSHLYAYYQKVLENQTRLINLIRENDTKKVIELLTTMDKADLNFSIPNHIMEVWGVGRGKDYYPMSIRPLQVIGAERNDEITGILLNAGADQRDLSLSTITAAALASNNAKNLMTYCTRYMEHSGQFDVEIPESEIDEMINLVIKDDQLELFQRLINNFMPNAFENNKKKIQFFETAAMALATNIVTFLLPKMYIKNIKNTYKSAMKHYVNAEPSSSWPNLKEEDIEDRKHNISTLLLTTYRESIVDSDSCPEELDCVRSFLSDTIADVIPKIALKTLKSIFSIIQIKKFRDDKMLYSFSQAAVEHGRLETVQYLMEEYFTKQKSDFLFTREEIGNLLTEEEVGNLLCLSGKNPRIEMIKYFIPFANTSYIRNTFLSVLADYEAAYSPNNSKENDELIVQKLGILLQHFQPENKDINVALKAAIRRKNIALIDIIKNAKKIKPEDEINFADFACQIAQDNCDGVFLESLLDNLLDPKGAWSLFVPAIKRLIYDSQNHPRLGRFLREYFKTFYPKIAPQLSNLTEILNLDDSKKLKELLDLGINPNAYVYVPMQRNAGDKEIYHSDKLTTLIMIALSQERWSCATLLLENGVIIDDGLSTINPIDIDKLHKIIEGGHRKILELILKNNFELRAIWARLEDIYSIITSEINMISRNIDSTVNVKEHSNKESGVSIKNSEDKLKILRQRRERLNDLMKFMNAQNDRFADFKFAVIKRDTKTIRELIETIPQIKLVGILKEFLETLVHPFKDITTLYNVTGTEQHFSPEGLQKFRKDPLMSENVAVLELLLMHTKEIYVDIELIVINTCVIARLCNRDFNIEKVRMIPCITQYSGFLWADAIRHFDLECMTYLLRQDKNNQGMNIKFSNCSKLGLYIALPDNPLNLLFLLLNESKAKQSDPEFQNNIHKVFKFMIANGLDIAVKDGQPNRYGLPTIDQRIATCTEPLRKSLFEILYKARRAEKNWATVGILTSFVRANQGNAFKYSILPVIPDILRFSGHLKNLQSVSKDTKVTTEPTPASTGAATTAVVATTAAATTAVAATTAATTAVESIGGLSIH